GSTSACSKVSMSRRTTLGTEGRADGCLSSLSRCMAVLFGGLNGVGSFIVLAAFFLRLFPACGAWHTFSVQEHGDHVGERPFLGVLAEHAAQVQAQGQAHQVREG